VFGVCESSEELRDGSSRFVAGANSLIYLAMKAVKRRPVRLPTTNLNFMFYDALMIVSYRTHIECVARAFVNRL
jgi:hypothetical protein